MPFLDDNLALFFLMMIWVIALNIAWFGAKFFIRRNNLKAQMFTNHLGDFKSLSTLSKDSYPDSIRRTAKTYFWIITIAILIPFILVAFLFILKNVR